MEQALPKPKRSRKPRKSAPQPPVPDAPAEAPALDSLPDAALAHVLSLLPLDARLRCTVLSKRFSALLRNPAAPHMRELSFHGVTCRLSAEALFAMVVFRRDTLRALDVTASPACDDLTLNIIIAALRDARCGLLEELRTVREDDASQFDPQQVIRSCSLAQAAALAASCPSLRRGAVLLAAGADSLAQTLTVLPGVRRILAVGDALQGAFTAALGAALGATSDVIGVNLRGRDAFAALLPALTARTPLRTLLVEDAELQDETAAALADALSASALTRLDLRRCTVQPAHLARIAAALPANRSLRRLRLFHCQGLDVDDAAALAAAVGSNTSLDTLHVARRVGDAIVAQQLAGALRSTSLRLLHLQFMPVDAGSAEALAAALEHNASLRELRLTDCMVADGALVSLGDALAQNRALQVLSVCGSMNMRPAGAGALGRALAANTTLRRLELAHSAVGAACAAALARGLATNVGLAALILEHTDIADDGAEALAKAIAKNKRSTLAELDLRFCNIATPAGATALARCLASNTSLTSVNLSENQINNAGAKAIAGALAVNRTLTELRMDWCSITSAGGAALGRALAANTALRVFDLSSNSIGDAGAKAFGEALERNSTLRSLSLSSCDIGNAGARALARGLAANATLRVLQVRENDEMTDAGAAALRRALQQDNTRLRRLLLGPDHDDVVRDA